jgi:hypothetical protein
VRVADGQDTPSARRDRRPAATEPTNVGETKPDGDGASRPDGSETKPDSDGSGDAAAEAAAPAASRTTRVLRRIRPGRAARAAGRAARAAVRATAAWSRRPSGRLIIPAVLVVSLVGAAGTAGAYLVPEAIEAIPSPRATPDLLPTGAPPSAAPGVGVSAPAGSLPPSQPSDTGLPGLPGLPGQDAPRQPGTGARPADALAGWAQQVGTRVGIPVVAVQAYGYSELVLNRTKPACHLSWTTLAAIAKVESAHGSANGAVLGADGQALPAIVGLPLDGKGGRQMIKDTDGGTLDGDTTFDRAMGPLQFIPTTWRENAVDADNNGVTDPNDIDDAALAAGSYLCRDGRDMASPTDWWDAILSYNDVRPYAQKVFTEANLYGERSRT